MNLFFDLDGTLLDSKPRLHALFNFLVSKSKLSFDEYWSLKRAGLGHEKILKDNFGYTVSLIEDFKSQWLSKIEEPEWLSYDKPYEGVYNKLQEWSVNNNLYLVTARQFITPVYKQLDFFGIRNFFSAVFVTEQKVEKQDIVLQHLGVVKDGWFIGDTGKDIQAGKALNMQTAAVLNGFRSRKQLEKYKPDCIIDFVTNFNQVIL